MQLRCPGLSRAFVFKGFKRWGENDESVGKEGVRYS
jgi:hypothetical protein